MSLTTENLQHIARLARLRLSHDEVEHLANDLNGLLERITDMQQVNTDGIEPMPHPHDLTQRLREDAVTEPNQREAAQACASAVDKGLYLVPKVIEG